MNRIIEENQDTITKVLTQEIRKAKQSMVPVGVNTGKVSEDVEFVHKAKSLLSTVIFAGTPVAPYDDQNSLLQNIRTTVATDPRASKEFQMKIPLIGSIKQAFGRTIRSGNDKGALVILDFRTYRLLKREMELLYFKNPNTWWRNYDNF